MIAWRRAHTFFSFSCRFVHKRVTISLLFHLFENRCDHVESGPFAWIFVHADADEFGHVRGRAGRDRDT